MSELILQTIVGRQNVVETYHQKNLNWLISSLNYILHYTPYEQNRSKADPHMGLAFLCDVP